MEDKTESLEVVKKQIYHLEGPRWRSRLHPGSKAIGIPDLYLHRSNVAEDDISEAAVKNGFSIPQMVGNETFSAHDMIFDRLKSKGLLSQIGSIFQEVILRREDICNHRNAAAPLQSRPPQRVTLNEIKLAAYVKELADPTVPLKKLARSVPHGYRGERMLDMLWNGGNLTQAMAAIKAQSTASSSSGGPSEASRSVTIERAIWFVRVVGSSELTSSRARQSNGNTYTSEWTAVVMLWLRRQLVELNVIHSSIATPTNPSSPAAKTNRTSSLASTKAALASTPHQDSHYSLLLEDDFRSRWVAKWHYSMMLLRGLCHEHLVDPQAAFKAALDMLRTANLAQVTLSMALVQEFSEAVYSNAELTDALMDTLCAKLADLNSTLEEGKFGEGIRKELESTVMRIIRISPDTLVNPVRWKTHTDTLTRLMQLSIPKDMCASIAHRNDKLLYACLDKRQIDMPVAKQQTDVAILDRIAVDLSVEEAFLELFGSSRQGSSIDKLRSILVWSTTTWRIGNHRPFAGAQLLNLFSQAKDTKWKRHGKSMLSLHKIDMGTFLLKWISEVEIAMQQSEPSQGSSRTVLATIKSVSVESLIILVGEAIRLGTFSYPKYLQRLTARGLTAAQSREEDKSNTAEFLHAKVMRSVPLDSASVSLEHQRRLAIYGNRTKESYEEAMQRRASKEMTNAFPWSKSSTSIEWNANEPLRHFWSSSRYVQHRVTQDHFMGYFTQIGKSHKPPTPLCMIQLSQFLAKAEDFASLCTILITILDRRQLVDPAVISICIDLVMEHRVVWISMRVTLLQQLGISIFPPRKAEKRAMQLYSIDEEMTKRMQESALSYIHGNHIQASLLLGEITSHGTASIGTLTCGALFSAINILTDSTQGNNGAFTLISWLKLIPEAVGTIWDTSWQLAVVGFLTSHDSSREDFEQALFNIVLCLIQCDMISTDDLLQHYVVPRLEQKATSTTDLPIQTAIDLIRALLLTEIDKDDLILLARLRCIRSTLITPDNIKDILSVIISLSLLEEQGSLQVVPSIRRALCLEPLIQLQFQSNLSHLCIFLEERLKGDSLSEIVASLLITQNTLSLSNALDIDYQSIIEDTNDWLCQQRLFELTVLVHRLDNVESSQQHRAQGKIETIACLSVEAWFRGSMMERYGIPLVTQSRSASFAKAVHEELLKRLQSALNQETVSDVVERIECVMRLIRASESLFKLPSITVSSTLLTSIGEWLTTTKDSWEEEVEYNSQREQDLGLRLAVVCLLLRFDTIWTSLSKAAVLQLIFALLTQAITLSCQGQVRDAVVNQILDVTAHCMQGMTSELRQAVQSMADTVVIIIKQAMPEDSVANRILFLFNRLPSTPANATAAATSMVIATSGTAAIVSGRFVPFTERPWELHNNVEALEYYLQDHQQQTSKDSSEVDNTFGPLVNNGPISLELFSAKKTRDRLPLADVQAESEVSYGLGWGGEPLFARDLRRGLLNLEADELVQRQERGKPEDVVVEEEKTSERKLTSRKRNEPASGQTAPKKKARKR